MKASKLTEKNGRLTSLLDQARGLYGFELDRMKALDDKLLAVIGLSGITLSLFFALPGGVFKADPTNCAATALRGWFVIGLTLLVLSTFVPLVFLVARASSPKAEDIGFLLDHEEVDPVAVYSRIYSAVWNSTRKAGDWKAKGLITAIVLYFVSLAILTPVAVLLMLAGG